MPYDLLIQNGTLANTANTSNIGQVTQAFVCLVSYCMASMVTSKRSSLSLKNACFACKAAGTECDDQQEQQVH